MWSIDRDILAGRRFEPFWEQSLDKGLLTQRDGVHTYLITSYYAAPLMVKRKRGLIVEVTDGNYLGYNECGVYYSLSKTSAVLLAYFMAQELRAHNVTAVSLTPGWLRSEAMLEDFGVAEDNWQDAVAENPGFGDSETPFYVGRAVVTLATDPRVMDRTGHALSAGDLARVYGFTDVDGRQPPAYYSECPFQDGGFVHL